MGTLERIKEFIDYKGLSVKKFEEAVGFSNGSFASQLKNKRTIGVDKLENILKVFKEINPDWLLTGRGKMLLAEEIEVQQNKKKKKKLGCPYYNVDFQGGFDLFYNNQTAIPEYFIDFSPYNKDGAVWCNVSGKSMEPEISNGDIVLIKEVPAWQDYIDFDDIYGIVTSNGFRTIKRVKKGSSNATFTLVPANPDFESQEIKKEMIVHLFKVLCAIKKF